MKKVLLAVVLAATMSASVALAELFVCNQPVNGQPNACGTTCAVLDSWDGTGCLWEGVLDFCAAFDAPSGTGCVSQGDVNLCNNPGLPNVGPVVCTDEECAAAASAACAAQAQ